MTRTQKLSMLRVMIGETPRTRRPEDDETLSVYLDMAGAKIMERLYPFADDYSAIHPPGSGQTDGDPTETYAVPEKYHMLQIKIATYLLNKRGAEGEVQHIENGTHRNYGDADVPEAMLSAIAPFVGVPG